MSANQCSLALDIDEVGLGEQDMNDPFKPYGQGRYLTNKGSSAIIDITNDVVEFGGTITISF